MYTIIRMHDSGDERTLHEIMEEIFLAEMERNLIAEH